MRTEKRDAKAELNRHTQACDVLSDTGFRVAKRAGRWGREGDGVMLGTNRPPTIPASRLRSRRLGRGASPTQPKLAETWPDTTKAG